MLFSWTDSSSWRRLLEAMPVRCSVHILQSRMRTAFDGVLVYHAARPRDVVTYYKRGLVLGSHADQKARAREIFLSGEFPELTEGSLAAAEDDIIPPIDDGRAFVSLDATGFIEYAGHYLIYGSEYLCGLAAGLTTVHGRDYRQVLKRFGIPTVFRLRLPFEAISESDASQLAQVLHSQRRRGRSGLAAPTIDFTFRLRQALPPECVLGHYHPDQVLDPLLGMNPYHYLSDPAP